MIHALLFILAALLLYPFVYAFVSIISSRGRRWLWTVPADLTPLLGTAKLNPLSATLLMFNGGTHWRVAYVNWAPYRWSDMLVDMEDRLHVVTPFSPLARVLKARRRELLVTYVPKTLAQLVGEMEGRS